VGKVAIIRYCIRQAFCDERGEALSQEQAGERLARELELDRQMRMYHRNCDNHTCDPYSCSAALFCACNVSSSALAWCSYCLVQATAMCTSKRSVDAPIAFMLLGMSDWFPQRSPEVALMDDYCRWNIAGTPAKDSSNMHDGLEYINTLPTDGESLTQPRLFMDLRPYIDCAPITVRFNAAIMHTRVPLLCLSRPSSLCLLRAHHCCCDPPTECMKAGCQCQGQRCLQAGDTSRARAHSVCVAGAAAPVRGGREQPRARHHHPPRPRCCRRPRRLAPQQNGSCT
jgi:hypothetical protein